MCNQNQETLQQNFRQSPRKQRRAWSPQRALLYSTQTPTLYIHRDWHKAFKLREGATSLSVCIHTNITLHSRLLYFDEAVLICYLKEIILPLFGGILPLAHTNFTPSLLFVHNAIFPLPPRIDGCFATSSATSWQPLLLNCSWWFRPRQLCIQSIQANARFMSDAIYILHYTTLACKVHVFKIQITVQSAIPRDICSLLSSHGSKGNGSYEI